MDNINYIIQTEDGYIELTKDKFTELAVIPIEGNNPNRVNTVIRITILDEARKAHELFSGLDNFKIISIEGNDKFCFGGCTMCEKFNNLENLTLYMRYRNFESYDNKKWNEVMAGYKKYVRDKKIDSIIDEK